MDLAPARFGFAGPAGVFLAFRFTFCDIFLTETGLARPTRVINPASAGSEGAEPDGVPLSGLRVCRLLGELKEQRTQFWIGDGCRCRAQASRDAGCYRRRGGGAARDGCLEWRHFGRDGTRGQSEGMHGGKDARLVHACARGPGGRFDQQQDAVVAQAGEGDVFAQRGRQQRNNSLAQLVNVTGLGRQLGDRAAL